MAQNGYTAGFRLKFFGGEQAPRDFWGGLAAMLVALPAAIAFGVAIFTPLGSQYIPAGALAGIIGTTIIGLLTAILGGTDRLISAPCAPAAAVLAAFALQRMTDGVAPDTIILLMVMLGVLAGIFQLFLGLIGVGRLIKYIPYPVVSGYLTAVGLIIIGSQLPKFVGAPADTPWWRLIVKPELWHPYALTIGMVTVVFTLLGPRLTQRVPGTILGLLAGVAAYQGLATQDDALTTLIGNPLVIGSLSASVDGYIAAVNSRWQDIGELHVWQISHLLGSAVTLAVLLSIDTLKTCVVIDQMTRSRHDSNRELVAQGIGNIMATALGGIPGAGTMGATLVNLSSGARSRASGAIEGSLALATALALGTFLAWIPVAALAGILLVVGIRMLDREPLRFIESRATAFDFAVVVVVVVVALTVGLIAASGAGVALSILLFVREQIGGSVVRHKVYANQRTSTWYRPETERRILEHKGDQAVIFELQGSLFFGTTQQLYSELEPELHRRRYVILDLRRVQSVDVTAAHLLNQVRDMLAEHQASLMLSTVRETLPNGRNLREFLSQTGVIDDDDPQQTVRVFDDLDSAIIWVEEQLLGASDSAEALQAPMQLQEMELFAHHKDETLRELEARMELRIYQPGEVVYTRGQPGDELYWIRQGTVRIFIPLGGGRSRHISSFSRGDFFGGLGFLDGRPRSNDAIAFSQTEMYVLSRTQFEQLSETHHKLAFNLVTAMARTLAVRLRYADNTLAMLQEY